MKKTINSKKTNKTQTNKTQRWIQHKHSTSFWSSLPSSLRKQRERCEEKVTWRRWVGGKRRRRGYEKKRNGRKKESKEPSANDLYNNKFHLYILFPPFETQTEGCHHGYQPMAILQSFHPSQQRPMTWLSRPVARLWYLFWTLFDCYGASSKNISQFDFKGLVDDLKKTTGEMQAMFAASNNNNDGGNVLFFWAYLWRTQ